MCSPVELTTIAELERQHGKLPPDYTHFLRQFGGARFFREVRQNHYHLIVFEAPRLEVQEAGQAFLRIGYVVDKGNAYLKLGSLQFSQEVFFQRRFTMKGTSKPFSDWLREVFSEIEQSYTNREWAAIRAGPAPFSREELEIVKALGQYSWSQIGLSPNGDIIFEVYNGSTRTLPFLTIGIESPGRLKGAARLPIAGIRPGEKKHIEYACYKGLVPPESIRARPLPPPEPEDRDFYFEFRIKKDPDPLMCGATP